MERIKIISYNVDGLPAQLDLAQLPWVLRPFTWLYKMVKGTTLVTVNDNDNLEWKADAIGRWLAEQEADIVAVQEDFAYHDLMIGPMADGYRFGTYTGGFELSRLFAVTEWMTRFPLPRFLADGLNIFTRKKSVEVHHETIVRWRKSYGYISHANDLLVHKGFRHYLLTVGDCSIDLYVVHMDADFYNRNSDVSGDVEARRAQFRQLADYIRERLTSRSERPVIIVGDTNSMAGNEWDNSADVLIERIGSVAAVHEALPVNYTDVDRLFYINNPASEYVLSVLSCRYDKSVRWSDHYPLIVEMEAARRE